MDRIKPIHMIIRDYLLFNIQSGEYQPSSQLPTENELTKKFQTSKSPVRQALDTLRIKGVDYRHPGRGTFVSPNPGGSDAWTLTSIRDIIIREVRLLKDQLLYFLNVFLPQKIGRKLRVTDIAGCPVIVALGKKLHIHLKKCIQNISATLANPPLARVLKVPNQSPLLSMERFYFTDNEETVEWASSFCRPDLYKYRSILSRG